MSNRKKLILNMRFSKDKVLCAKSPEECKGCGEKRECESMVLYYYPFNDKDIKECFRNNEKRK